MLTRLFRISRCFELKSFSLRFAPQLFTISYVKIPLFGTIFRFP